MANPNNAPILVASPDILDAVEKIARKALDGRSLEGKVGRVSERPDAGSVCIRRTKKAGQEVVEPYCARTWVLPRSGSSPAQTMDDKNADRRLQLAKYPAE